MNIIHPITRVLKRQIRDDHVTMTDGRFSPSFSYAIGMHKSDEVGMKVTPRPRTKSPAEPYLIISASAQYRDAIGRMDGQPGTGADLIEIWDDRIFLPSKRAIRTLAGLLGEGEAFTAFPYGKETRLTYNDLRESEPLLRRERENARPRAFPQLVMTSSDAYALSAHSHLGELEEKLPWFRFGTLQYGNERHVLTFEIDKPSQAKGKVTVAFNLTSLEKVDLPAINAVSWYMHRLSEK